MKTTILIFTALLVQISCQAVSPDKGEMRKPRLGARPLIGSKLQVAKKRFENTLLEVAKKGGPHYRIIRIYSAFEDLGHGTLRTFIANLNDTETRKDVKCTVKVWSKPGKNKVVTFKCGGRKEIVQKLKTKP